MRVCTDCVRQTKVIDVIMKEMGTGLAKESGWDVSSTAYSPRGGIRYSSGRGPLLHC